MAALCNNASKLCSSSAAQGGTLSTHRCCDTLPAWQPCATMPASFAAVVLLALLHKAAMLAVFHIIYVFETLPAWQPCATMPASFAAVVQHKWVLCQHIDNVKHCQHGSLVQQCQQAMLGSSSAAQGGTLSTHRCCDTLPAWQPCATMPASFAAVVQHKWVLCQCTDVVTHCQHGSLVQQCQQALQQ